jgi:hypothetical protein
MKNICYDSRAKKGDINASRVAGVFRERGMVKGEEGRDKKKAATFRLPNHLPQ